VFDVERARADVRAGLLRAPRVLPPTYFYDERGSALFDEITRLDEYYLTRAEHALLRTHAPTIIARTAPCTLVELGAGSASKTELLLDALVARGSGTMYLPVDVSAAHLERAAARLRSLYPALHVQPVAADYLVPFDLPPHPAPALHAFLGSTIGNFAPEEAIRFLTEIRSRMEARDHFLLGADLRKDAATIERAYNDEGGVTAEFNRNALRVLNATIGSNFDPDAFEHRAVYDTHAHRIEMYLVPRTDQHVRIPDVGDIEIPAGEAILTEVSYKYDRATVIALLADSGMALDEWISDSGARFALALARPV
jgi:L-histidine N-alpha-methyltransferase